jgi:hypothetical protein
MSTIDISALDFSVHAVEKFVYGMPMAEQTFEIRYGSVAGRALGVMGLGRSRSHVTVGHEHIQARMGWGFRATIPIDSIVSARLLERRVWSWGVHGWSGKWLVNGSAHGLVVIDIDPGAPARAIGFRVKLRELTVSLSDADGFLAAVNE